MSHRLTRRFRRRGQNERGAALLELAISIPIFIGLLALIFDAGLGFASARTTASAARSSARIAAHAGADRLADYRALDAVRAEFGGNNDDTVVWVTVYRSPAFSDGFVPAGCKPGDLGIPGTCNVYPGAMLDTLSPTDFDDGDNGGDCVDDPDENWCPLDRKANEDDYLGVGVWASHEPTIGLTDFGGGEDVALEDRAVFALYFRDDPVAAP